MRDVIAKIMLTLACTVILIHATIPHYHHDCDEGVGIVFENEINCQCESNHHAYQPCYDHHGGSHHPIDKCMLQEMLSHLVLSKGSSEQFFCTHLHADAHISFILAIPDFHVGQYGLNITERTLKFIFESSPIHPASAMGAVPLRAPPSLA